MYKNLGIQRVQYTIHFGFVSEKNGLALLSFSNAAIQYSTVLLCTQHLHTVGKNHFFICLLKQYYCLLCHLIMELRIIIDIEGPLS